MQSRDSGVLNQLLTVLQNGTILQKQKRVTIGDGRNGHRFPWWRSKSRDIITLISDFNVHEYLACDVGRDPARTENQKSIHDFEID
jgi:hypothetical protein